MIAEMSDGKRVRNKRTSHDKFSSSARLNGTRFKDTRQVFPSIMKFFCSLSLLLLAKNVPKAFVGMRN